MDFFTTIQWLGSLADSDSRVNILCDNDAFVENAKILGYDKSMPNPALYLEDEDGDKVLVYERHIISITPVVEVEEDDEEEYKFDQEPEVPGGSV